MSGKYAVVICLAAAVLLLQLTGETHGSSMLYKKNDHDKYEPDLVAVSSTVIPLTEYQASAGLVAAGDSPKFYSEEYKQAYLRHLQKKQKLRQMGGDAVTADRLITG